MTQIHLNILLLALVTFQIATTQNGDDLQIPVENDNQFPPDNFSDVIEGSGEGVIEVPATGTTASPAIEHIESRILLEDNEEAPSQGDEDVCPKPCVCRIEGNTNDFVIDCSGYGLTEFPSPLNEKATILNIQNNKITEIPKLISTLKKLKVLKASNNEIMTLVPGSISELPEIVSLEFRNNRLIEYPNDLKNSFGLLKLQELDLGGNDMRTTITPDVFSKFESLSVITLPVTTPDFQQDLCDLLSKSLLKVCTESCEHDVHNCKDEAGDADDLPVLAGMLIPNDDDDGEPTIDTQEKQNIDSNNSQETVNNTANAPKIASETTPDGEFSFRSAVNKQPVDAAPFNSIVESPEKAPITTEATVKLGATTSDTKTGGVDKTIIGLVVVGMVVIVAVITIKKNWSSIKKRFSSNSNSRTPSQPVGANANGTAPEEVPLQDKSPV